MNPQSLANEYQWLTLVDDDIASLLFLCPEIVLGKYLAVTSIGGGSLHLAKQEEVPGWWTSKAGRVFTGTDWSPPAYQDEWKIAYSPRVTSLEGLPHTIHDGCCSGYDEWYVFEEPAPVEDMETFVSWVGFRLDDPCLQWTIERFWRQIAKSRPESYIGFSTVLTVVTRNALLIERLRSI